MSIRYEIRHEFWLTRKLDAQNSRLIPAVRTVTFIFWEMFGLNLNADCVSITYDVKSKIYNVLSKSPRT